MDSDPCSAAEKLRIALSLFEAGEAMMRARLRRERPLASDAEIDEAVLVWLRDADDGDLDPVSAE